MEAATPLRKPHVRTAGDHLVIDALVVAESLGTLAPLRMRKQTAEAAVAAEQAIAGQSAS